MSGKYIVEFLVVWVTSVRTVGLTSPKKCICRLGCGWPSSDFPLFLTERYRQHYPSLFHLHHLTIRHPCRSWTTLSQNYSCDVRIMPIRRTGVSQPSSRPQMLNPT